MDVGYLADAFDMLDARDLGLIDQAAEACTELVVGVFTDEYAERLLGHPPVVPLAERLELVSHVRGIWAVQSHDEQTSIPGHVGQRAAQQEPGPAQERVRSPVVGYVPGAWDMFHIGHLNILKRARDHCDRLVVGVVTDEALVAVKARPPMVGLEDRMAVVRALDLVDEVTVDFSADKRDVWSRVGFDVLFKGDDWRGTPKGDRLEADMSSVGVRVCYFPYTAHTSSTRLRSLLAER